MQFFAIPLIGLFLLHGAHAQVTVSDIFGRNLSGEEIILVDWEGHMANPAIKISVNPPPAGPFPFEVNLSANHSRLYFNNPSSAGSNGPTKMLTFNDATPQQVFLSIFPDRTDGNESYILSVSSSLGIDMYEIKVIDQDSSTTTIDFDILFDYSEDTLYHLFDATKKTIAERAANDWAFFIEDMNFDQVAFGNQQTFIWKDDFASGHWAHNSMAFQDFYLYMYGLHVGPHRSGAAPSVHAFHTIGGVNTDIRRSGAYHADPHGNFNTLMWDTNVTDDTWYLATNLGGVANDLYSIAMHEIGHALTFNAAYPKFSTFKTQGFIDDNDVVDYHGGNVPVDSDDHLNDGNFVLDRISRQGVFGSEYAQEMPLGRWLITKLNLLIMQAIGFDIKTTSAFDSLSIETTTLKSASINVMYRDSVIARGGIPFYRFTVASGNLPNGIELNSFTDVLSGTPSASGQFNFTIKVEDYDMLSVQKAYTMEIIPAVDTCITFVASDLPLNISDNATISSKIDFPFSGKITDVNIKNLQGDHTFVGDLTFTLISPDGTSIILIQNKCGDQDNFDLNLDDQAMDIVMCDFNLGVTARPENSLSTLNDENPQGAWMLMVNDNDTGDTGSLNSWSIEICGAINFCEDVMVLDQTPIPGGKYQAATQLTSMGTIAAGTHITFQAGENVVLNPSFEVESTGLFEIMISPCN